MPNSAADDTLLARMRKRFERACSAESENRQNAVDDLKFKKGDQWQANIQAQRLQDRRPCLTINKVPTFVNQVVNDLRMNRPAINVLPVGDTSHKDAAEVWKGWLREIQRNCDADIAYDTGVESAIDCGFGYWRIVTEYESDKTLNQVPVVKRIRNRFTVYLDPDRQQPDGSDIEWGFVTVLVPRDQFKDEYPRAAPISFNLTGIGESLKNWADDKNVRLAEYFEIEHAMRRLVHLRSGHVGYFDELLPEVKEQIAASEAADLVSAGVEPMILAERQVDTRQVKWYKCSGVEVLEKQDWPGFWIPIIECVGQEIDDGQNITRAGMIRAMKDPQRMYNYNRTAQVESNALQPKAPYIMAEGQDEGHEDEWNSANQQAYSRLRYKPVALGDQLAPPPQRQPPPQASVALIQAAETDAQDMIAVTGVRFGDATKAERFSDESGISLQRLTNMQNLGSFHYADNYARSLRHTGRVLLDLGRALMDTPRGITTLGEDGKEDRVRVDPHMATAFKKVKGPDGKNTAVFNPREGEYEVTVAIGPNYATKMQESSRSMIEFGKMLPNQVQLFSDLIAKNQDWPGSDEIAKRLASTLPPGMLSPDDMDLPPEAQALIGQMQQAIKQRDQLLQQLQTELTDKKADRAVEVDKINKDFEASIFATIEKAQASAAADATKREDAFLTHIRAELDAIRDFATQRGEAQPRETGA